MGIPTLDGKPKLSTSMLTQFTTSRCPNHPKIRNSWAIVGLGVLLVLVSHAIDNHAFAQTAPNPEQKLVMAAKPSVVRVWSVYLATFELGSDKFEQAIGGTGSGFFITSDGYIATNAHVVEPAAVGDDGAKKELRRRLIADITKQYASALSELSVASRQRLFDDIRLTDFKKMAYVVLPNGDKLDYEVKAYGVPGEGKDAAIIKVTTQNAPTLPIADSSKAQVADRIVVIGYPGVADFKGLLDEKSQLEASVTEGSIAALKRANSGDPILQISAPITHGNSGGPAINESGQVIGLATFGNEGEVQGFNFLVASATLSEFVKQIKISPAPGKTNIAWNAGLELFWQHRYTAAITKFEEVTSLFPAHSESAHLVELANQYKKDGKEAKPAAASQLPIVAGSIGGGIGVLIGALLLSRRKRKTVPPAAGWTPPMGHNNNNNLSPSYAPPPASSPNASPYQPPGVVPRPPGIAPPVLTPMAGAPLGINNQAQWQPVSPGHPIAKTVAIAPAASNAPVAPTAFGSMAIGSLTCVRGLLQGQRFALSPQGLLIGRQPGLAQIVVNDPRSSGKHVWIGIENGRLVCIDQGTTNGTFINDVGRGRISKVELRDGDTIIVAEPDVLSLQIKLS
jgi:S1-C subfamily serine protease